MSRIAELDLNNEDYFMASENVFDVAKKMKFWKVYSGKKPFTIRELFVFNTLAPSLKLDFKSDELPFSVKVDMQVNIRQVVELYHATYECTEYEMIRDLMVDKKEKDKNGKLKVVGKEISPAAHPWLSTYRRNLLNSLEKDAIVRERPTRFSTAPIHGLPNYEKIYRMKLEGEFGLVLMYRG
jgi:dipeptidase